MIGRNHSVLTLMTLIVTLVILILFFKLNLYGIHKDLRLVFWILLPVFVFLGSISPDSDVRRGKSLIYYVSLPFAYFMKTIEVSIAIISGHKIEHRGVLHKPIGVIITSLAIFIIIYFILFLVGHLNFYFALYLALAFLVSQTLHIFQDKMYDKFGRISSLIFFVIVLIVVLGIVLWFFI